MKFLSATLLFLGAIAGVEKTIAVTDYTFVGYGRCVGSNNKQYSLYTGNAGAIDGDQEKNNEAAAAYCAPSKSVPNFVGINYFLLNATNTVFTACLFQGPLPVPVPNYTPAAIGNATNIGYGVITGATPASGDPTCLKYDNVGSLPTYSPSVSPTTSPSQAPTVTSLVDYAKLGSGVCGDSNGRTYSGYGAFVSGGTGEAAAWCNQHSNYPTFVGLQTTTSTVDPTSIVAACLFSGPPPDPPLIFTNPNVAQISNGTGATGPITQTITNDTRVTCYQFRNVAPLPTFAPSSSPPTSSPTLPVPTSSPSKSPVKSPTKVPTKAPTMAPTKVPTKAPTMAPTHPTKAPTMAPTTFTKAPTTQAPTSAPTTQAPTSAPTTQAPTSAPTKSPVTLAPTQATKAPATPSPVTGTSAPVTPAPATSAPVTPAPQATKAPVTPSPVTGTSAPVTPAPVTPAPATSAPVTPAPATHAPTAKAGKIGKSAKDAKDAKQVI